MIYYWLIFFIPAIFSIVTINSFKNLDKFFWLIFITLLTLFLGFRYEVGGDWGIYRHNFFDNADKFYYLYFDLRSDYLFDLLSWIIHSLGFNFITLNLICSVIFIYAISSFCLYQKQPWLALMIAIPHLIIVVSMGYVRQATALAFIMLAISNIIKKNDIKFILFIIIAILFHKSAILIIIPLLFIDKKIISMKNIILLLLLLFFIFLFNIEIKHLIRNYIGMGRNTNFYDTSTGVYFRIIMNLIPAVCCLIYGKYLSDNDIEKKLFFIISLLILLSSLFIFHYSTFVDRIIIYLSIIQIYVFSRLSSLCKTNINFFLVNISIVAFYLITLYVWLNYARFSFQWIPYKYNFNLFL